MTQDATLDHEGAPGMDAPNAGQDPGSQTTTDGVANDGVPLDETNNQTDPPKSPREHAIEAITANRMLEFAEETGAPPDPEYPAPAERRLKVKVDGEELDLSEAEVIKGFQKDQTASRRLEQAATETKRVQDEWARLNTEREAFEQARKAAPAADDTTNSQATPLPGDEWAKETYEALVSGDEDEAVNAIKKLTQGRQTEATPPEKIAAEVRRQIDWEDAQKAFARDYADIQADPLLKQIASNTFIETLKTSTSYDQAFREAGDRTRAWARRVGGASAQDDAGGDTPPADPGLTDKQSRKERIDNPTAINVRAGGRPQEQAATPRDVSKQMREARGLPA